MKKTLLLLSMALSVNAFAANQAPKASDTGYVIDIEQVKRDFAIPKTDEEVITKEVIANRNAIFDNAKIQSGQNLPEIKTEVDFSKMKPQKGNVLPDINDIGNFHQVEDVKKSDINLNAMLEHYQKLQQSGVTTTVKDSQMESGRAYLFVSSSMPKETLRNLMHEASSLGITVFFKGNIDEKNPLKFGLMKDYLAGLNLKSFVDIKIHPPAFTKFKIDKVPAIVVAAEDVDTRLDENGCANPLDYDIVRGDIKLGWGIEKIYTSSKADSVKTIAAQYMEKINASKGLD
jgi:type-F conjugative transfer system pilin assembly protein TrbC